MHTMRIETDIGKIERLAREGAESDRRFRRLLGTCKLKSDEIDAIVRRLYFEVRGQVDCLACGNCCRTFSPTLNDKDIDRLALGLKMTREELIRKHLCGTKDGESLALNTTPCPFLAGNECKVYDHRPDVCRSYPGLDRPGFVSNLSLSYSNRSVCPIYFNVYELLKQGMLPGRREAGRLKTE
jgi:Fe-S-cluster containining protein